MVKKIIDKVKEQKGAALVEFAIVLPLILLLIFGMIEFSILFDNQAVITNASREGARFGIVYDYPNRPDVDEITQRALTYCEDRLSPLARLNLWLMLKMI